MFSELFSAVLLANTLFSALTSATQVDLSTVGPLTPLSSKTKICNILDYGGIADNSTDIGPAIELAFSSCAITGAATIYIPPGSYSLQTGVVLNKGSAYAIQIDGLITLTSDGSYAGNAFILENGSDIEVFSSNGLGAISGQGYITRLTSSGQNARLFRFISCTSISIHDIIFVDSPTFHLVFNDVSNLEAYHITIRGPDLGGTDGVDLICTDNCYLHDIEVTNRDECISVKSPSQNVLIEDIYCNQSGGMSIGSLTADDVTADTEAAVSNITMRNIYVYQCTQMLMIKTFPGGTGATGYVKDSVFENFWAYDTTYGLDIDQYWESTTTPDTGAVALSALTFNNWTGTVDNGISRAPIVIRGSDIVPLTDITLSNFDMWTVNENEILNQCKNVYGTGYCAATSTAGQSLTTFTTTVTTTSPPAGFTSPTSPAWGVSGYGVTIPIPVYTPAVFWSPESSGVASASSVASAKAVTKTSSSVSVPVSTTKAVVKSSSSTVVKSSTSLAVAVVASSTLVVVKSSSASVVKSTSAAEVVESSSITASSTPVVVISSSSSVASPTATSSGVIGTLGEYYQCGGEGWTGTGSCVSGTTCIEQNEWYSQCVAETSTTAGVESEEDEVCES
ncbi:carbohydrate-binding module family 1 protein [Hyaloscypha variabilis]